MRRAVEGLKRRPPWIDPSLALTFYGLLVRHLVDEPLLPRKLIGIKRGLTLAVDRELLKEALGELVPLRTKTVGTTGLSSELYTAALGEWAGRLGVEARKLNKLVLVKEALPVRRVL